MKALLKETEKRLIYNNSKLEDLRKCMQEEQLSKDAQMYIKEQIYKTNKNIEYYSNLINFLENYKKKVSE